MKKTRTMMTARLRVPARPAAQDRFVLVDAQPDKRAQHYCVAVVQVDQDSEEV